MHLNNVAVHKAKPNEMAGGDLFVVIHPDSAQFKASLIGLDSSAINTNVF